MENILNGSRYGIEGTNRIYVQGNYLEWYDENDDWVDQEESPIVWDNLELSSIDEDGIWLVLEGTSTLLEDDTWHICEKNCTETYNYLDSGILKEELEDDDWVDQ